MERRQALHRDKRAVNHGFEHGDGGAATTPRPQDIQPHCLVARGYSTSSRKRWEHLERLAADAQALDPRELVALHLLFAHPLLSISDLAALLGVMPDSAGRYLRTPLRLGLVAVADSIAANETPLAGRPPSITFRSEGAHHRVCGQARYVLTPAGLALLAASSGFSGLSGPVALRSLRTADDDGPHHRSRRLTGYAREVRTLERVLGHTAGVYSFFAKLHTCASIEHAAGRECAVLWWESGSACARQYRDVHGWHAIRPDGAGELVVAGRRMRFWLEWDHGTMNVRDLRRKFAAYAHYVRSREWQVDGNSPLSDLLVVASDSTQETRIIEALAAQDVSLRALGIKISLAAQLHARGPLAAIWRPWLPAASSSSRIELGAPLALLRARA